MKPLTLYFSDVVLHRLSQILYRCFETVESTKAALFIRVPSEQGFRLVSHYGWPRAAPPPEILPMDHPTVIWLQREKRSMAVNQASHMNEVQDFVQGGENPRLFLSPIYSKGDWLGLLVQRDKSRGKPYDLETIELPTEIICQDIAETLNDTHTPGQAVQSQEVIAVSLPPSDYITQTGHPPAHSPDEQLEGYRLVADDQQRFGEVDELQITAGGSYDPVANQPTVQPAPPRVRTGIFMPEQRTYFWEAAALLVRLAPADAISLWMDDDNNTVRPVLTYSIRPLTPELKQQVLTHISHHLNRIEERDLRILTTVELAHDEPMAGVFQTYLPVVLMGEGGQDMMLLFRQENRPFTSQEQHYIQSVARMVGLHIQEIRLHERYHRSFLGVSHNLLSSVEGLPTLRDQSLATARLARSFGRYLELPAASMEAICIAAILHDVGTTLLDPALLHKPGLTAEEMEQLRSHPVLATSFLKDLRFPFDVPSIIRHHHERWDGKGYPDSVKGEAIPLGSRIINLVESFNVMRLGNEFHVPKPMRDILTEIRAEAGKQFDPNLVSEFMDYLRIRSAKGL